MITFPNQKVVTIHKSAIANGDLYLRVKLDDMFVAMQNLTSSAFKIWLYLSSNLEDYTLALSCADVCAACGLSERTFHKAVNELIDKNYIVQIHGNTYDFNTYPNSANSLININIPNNEQPQESRFIF